MPFEHAADGAALTDQAGGLLRGARVVVEGLLPRPRSVSRGAGTVTWSSPLRVTLEAPWSAVVDTFAADLHAAVGWTVEVVPEGADVVIGLDEQLGAEEYRLNVDTCTTIEATARLVYSTGSARRSSSASPRVMPLGT